MLGCRVAKKDLYQAAEQAGRTRLGYPVTTRDRTPEWRMKNPVDLDRVASIYRSMKHLFLSIHCAVYFKSSQFSSSWPAPTFEQFCEHHQIEI